MPSISVVMATYNGERFIYQQLNSLLGQTAQIDELIVSDDGSTDRTLDILEEFSKSAPFRVSITRNGARLGYRENFMQAASLADCDLIAFCDQDDIWDSQKLSQSIVPFADPEVLLVHVSDHVARVAGREVSRHDTGHLELTGQDPQVGLGRTGHRDHADGAHAERRGQERGGPAADKQDVLLQLP